MIDILDNRPTLLSAIDSYHTLACLLITDNSITVEPQNVDIPSLVLRPSLTLSFEVTNLEAGKKEFVSLN